MADFQMPQSPKTSAKTQIIQHDGQPVFETLNDATLETGINKLTWVTWMVCIFACSKWPEISQNLPSGYVKIAIENGPFIVDLPIKNGDCL